MVLLCQLESATVFTLINVSNNGHRSRGVCCKLWLTEQYYHTTSIFAIQPVSLCQNSFLFLFLGFLLFCTFFLGGQPFLSFELLLFFHTSGDFDVLRLR